LPSTQDEPESDQNDQVWFRLILERRQELIKERMDQFQKSSLQKIENGEWTYDEAARRLDEFLNSLKEHNNTFNDNLGSIISGYKN